MFRSEHYQAAFVLLVLALGMSSVVVAQATDECSNPLIPALNLGSQMGTNVGSTTSVGFLPSCVSGANQGINSDVWFTFTPTNTGFHQIDTNNGVPAGQLSDTVLAIYAACAPGDIICNDDGGAGALSLININLTAGTTYYIQVGDFGYTSVSQGTFWVNVNFIPPPPANDSCAGAIPISEGVVVVGSSLGATLGLDPVGTCAVNGNDVWYSFVAGCTGPYRVTTCGPVGFDEVVTVWSGTCGSLVQVACEDDTCGAIGGPAYVLFPATAGVTYYVSVAGFGAGSIFASGAFHLYVGPSATFTLSFFDAGPGTGSIGFVITGGPPGGTVFTAITGAAGLYPNDWFFGIAISIPDIFNQFVFGFPFLAPLGPCGDLPFGPIFGLPSGVTLYAVSLGFSIGAATPTLVSNPDSHMIP